MPRNGTAFDEMSRAARDRAGINGAEEVGWSDTDAWPAPDLSAARQNRRAPPRLPVEVFGPMWSEWIAIAAEGGSCPPDYVAGPLLATAAMLMGNARWVSPWQGWSEPPVLWFGVVGDPSAGKSPGAD